ncbi:MAG: ribulose-phosphate 3-epimerase [Patescibacteria group bacterium]|jgi:ribulose-phosphate 3-epimerase
MSVIVPAILESDAEAFHRAVETVSAFSDLLHIDLADGRFVPNKTISLDELKNAEPQKTYRVHLMYDQPEHVLQKIEKLRAECIIIHAEATHNLRAVVEAIRACGKKVGVALNPETPLSAMQPIADILSFVLFMAVKPGFQGSPFMPDVIRKIADFQKNFPGVTIGIDGAMNKETIPLIKPLKIANIVVGSAIIKQADPAAAFRELTQLT